MPSTMLLKLPLTSRRSRPGHNAASCFPCNVGLASACRPKRQCATGTMQVRLGTLHPRSGGSLPTTGRICRAITADEQDRVSLDGLRPARLKLLALGVDELLVGYIHNRSSVSLLDVGNGNGAGERVRRGASAAGHSEGQPNETAARPGHATRLPGNPRRADAPLRASSHVLRRSGASALRPKRKRANVQSAGLYPREMNVRGAGPRVPLPMQGRSGYVLARPRVADSTPAARQTRRDNAPGRLHADRARWPSFPAATAPTRPRGLGAPGGLPRPTRRCGRGRPRRRA